MLTAKTCGSRGSLRVDIRVRYTLQSILAFLLIVLDIYIMRLVVVLSMCFVLSVSADAAKLSQLTKRFVERMNTAAQKAVIPVKQGVVGVACAGMLCAFGLQDAHGLSKIALIGTHSDSVSSAGLEIEGFIEPLGENHMGQRLFYEPSWMEGFSFGYFDAKVVYDGDGLHLPRVRLRTFYDYGFPGNLTYASGKGLRAERSLFGWDYHDFRTHGFDNEATEGFTALYHHLVSPGFIGYL